MTKRILSFARTARFLPLWAVIAALLPTESSALIPRDLPDAAPFFVTDWVICRNDPASSIA